MTEKQLYNLMLPHDNVRFKKTRWLTLVLIKELAQKKFRAVFKYYWKRSYRRDINHLKDILSRGKLHSKSSFITLGGINFSHEINYPKWVKKLEQDLKQDPNNYEPIKIFLDGDKWIVIDGNHRLQALKNTFGNNELIKVRKLSYIKN